MSLSNMPPMGAQPPSAAQGAPDQSQGQSGGSDMSQGYEITITVGANNQVQSVDVEPGGGDDGSGAMPDAQDGSGNDSQSGTAVSKWSDAIKVATDIYNNSGQMGGNEQDQMQQGFDQAFRGSQ